MAAPVETGRWPDRISGEWTIEALETLPDNGLRYEILDGTLLVTPSPTPRHQGAILELAVLLRETTKCSSLRWTGNPTAAPPWNPT